MVSGCSELPMVVLCFLPCAPAIEMCPPQFLLIPTQNSISLVSRSHHRRHEPHMIMAEWPMLALYSPRISASWRHAHPRSSHMSRDFRNFPQDSKKRVFYGSPRGHGEGWRPMGWAEAVTHRDIRHTKTPSLSSLSFSYGKNEKVATFQFPSLYY